MTDHLATDTPAAGQPHDIWTDVDALDRLTQRASRSGEQMAAVVFAAAQHASAMRVGRAYPTAMASKPAPVIEPKAAEPQVVEPQVVEPEVVEPAPPIPVVESKPEPVAPPREEPAEPPLEQAIDWPKPQAQSEPQPEPQPQTAAAVDIDPPATYPLLGGDMLGAPAEDDDSDTIDMQAPALADVPHRTRAARRAFHWAAMIAFVVLAGLLYTGKLRIPVIEKAIARQAVDSLMSTTGQTDLSGNLPPAWDADAVPPAEQSTAEPIEPEIDAQPKLRDPRPAAPEPAEPAADVDADQPPLIILPTDGNEPDDADTDADTDDSSGTSTLFDEPMSHWNNEHHAPAPSLFGPDPVVAGTVVADAHVPASDDMPQDDDHFADDVAKWIAAHQQAWFPAPDATRESTPRVRRVPTSVPIMPPVWLDALIDDAVRGRTMPSMLESARPMLP